MNNTLRLVLKILAVVAFLLSGFWTYFSFGYEPVIALVASLSALITLFVTEIKVKDKNTGTQIQKSGNSSKNYQAGGDININTPNND